MPKFTRSPDAGWRLQAAINQLVDEAPSGWEDAYGRAVVALDNHVRTGVVSRREAVWRLTHVLRRWTTVDDAQWLAEAVTRPGSPNPLPVPPPPPRARMKPSPPVAPTLAISTISGPMGPTPRGVHATWSSLAARLTDVREYDSKKACPLWSPARFRAGRRKGPDVIELSCLVLDFDEGVHWDAILPRWVGVAAVVHTSWSHTLEIPKWRLVMPLTRPVQVSAWARTWRWASGRVEGKNDLKCKDPCRFYFAPARPRGAEHHHAFVLDGRTLDVPESVLATPRPTAPPPRPRREVRPPRRSELYRSSEQARRELGIALGGKLVAGDTQVKGVTCPQCSRPSLTWWVTLGDQLKARCNHRTTAAKAGCDASFWLDELEA